MAGSMTLVPTPFRIGPEAGTVVEVEVVVGIVVDDVVVVLWWVRPPAVPIATSPADDGATATIMLTDPNVATSEPITIRIRLRRLAGI